MAKNEAYRFAEWKIKRARRAGATKLDLVPTAHNSQKLAEVPESLGQLSQLLTLDIQGNRLTALPESLGKLSQLQWLSLSGNQLTTLPESLGKLSQLHALYLIGNQLTALPEWLGNLSRLQELGLTDNQLTALPESLGQLSQLESLNLVGNQLTALPESLGQLSQLMWLNLDDNQLTALPESLGQLTKLQGLTITRNPLPAEILRLAENGKLIAYLRDLAASKAAPRFERVAHPPRPFNEAKLLLVGPGGVGKTWLLQALQGKVPEDKGAKGSTKGLEIAREPLDVPHPTEEGRTLHLNCWDFGGQEHYQITHQIFFSPKAIYLLIWNPRDGIDPNLVTRLERIQLSAGRSAKVFIVSTHAEGNVPAVIGQDTLRKRFGDLIQGFHAVDSQRGPEGTGIAELKTAVAKAAAGLDGIDTLYPAEWHASQKAIRAERTPTLTFCQFVELCCREKMNPESCEALAVVMDVLGNAVFFGDAPTPGAAGVARDENLVVLNPEWLAKAVTFVLEDEETRQNSGLLAHRHLREVWKTDEKRGCPGYDARLFGYLLWLMWKFDIAYKQNEHTSLLPELIHRNRPDDLRWTPAVPSPKRQAALICRMRQDAPVGLIPVLTAAAHPLRRMQGAEPNSDRLDRNWREGFFLDTALRGTAFVELLDRDLWITVRDDYPSDLCRQIRKTLDRVVTDRWPRLLLDYRVPCIGTTADGKPCVGAFKLDYLEPRRGKQVPCQYCDCDKVDVDKMLEGFDARTEEIMQKLHDLRHGQADLMAAALQIYRDVLDPAREELLRAPNMFTILPETGSSWNLVAKATENRLCVTCWCEHPDGPHPTTPIGSGEPPDYVLKSPKDWLVKAAPYISWAATLFKAFAPLAGTVVKQGLEGAISGDLKAAIDRMEAASKAIPTGKLELGQQDDLESMHRLRPEIVALRHIHDALLAQVPEGKRWGDLRPVRTKSGDLLWLCAEHAALQQPPVQKI